MEDVDRIRAALEYVSPVERDIWVRMAMAIKSELGDSGFDLWDAWGQQANTYHEADARTTWKSVKSAGRVKIATLFHIATENGWRDDGSRQRPDAAKLQALRQEAEARAAKEAEAQAVRRVVASKKAAALWKKATAAKQDHGYLIRKRVYPVRTLREIDVIAAKSVLNYAPKARGGKMLAGRLLVVPVKIGDSISTLELIDEAGTKTALSGGAKSGGYWAAQPLPKGDGAGVVLAIGEGVATVLSVVQATGHAGVAALSCGNLKAVALAMRERLPLAAIVVLADIGAGQGEAEEAARAAGAVAVAPAFVEPRPDGWKDMNDLAASDRDGEGAEAVRRLIAAALARLAQQGPDASEAVPGVTDGQPAEDVPAPNEEAGTAHPDGQTGDRFDLVIQGEGAGVWRLKWQPPKGKDGQWFLDRQYVCAPLDFTHMVRDRNSDGWSRLAEFRDHDGRVRRVLVPDDLLEGDGLALARMLRGRGLFIGDNKGGLLKMYANSQRPDARARLTRRIGWHEDVTTPGRFSYVMGGDAGLVAPAGAEMWLHDAQGTGHAQFRSAATLSDWRANVSALAVGNSRLTFALSAGFAAALVWLHPNIAGGFHWSGGSSLGKSALLFATASLCGAPTYRRTWLLTSTAIEATAAGHCDAPLLLDELKQAGNPRDVAQAAYMLTSGQGKGRGQAAGGLRETVEFSLLFQSNGEIGLTQFLEESQERAYAGQEVRFCELPGDAGAGFGAWDTLHDLADGARFTEAVQRRSAKYYGTAWPEFVRHVVEQRDGLPVQFEQMRTQFERAGLTDRAGGQAIRAATRFAAVGFAGELATAWGVTGWPKGAAVQAAMRMFKDWLETFGGEENREPRKMVEQARAWIQAHSAGRLEDWRRPGVSDSHAPRTMNRAGWRRPTKETAAGPEANHVLEYLIYPAAFKAELCAGFDPSQVARELHQRGLLERSKDRLMVKAREPGASQPSWFYLLTPAILGTVEHDD